MAVMKLTQEGIAELQCPENKRSIQVCCKQHPGLLLELRRSDPRPTWYVRYKSRDTGKTRYVHLGHFPDVSLADAREKAAVLAVDRVLHPEGDDVVQQLLLVEGLQLGEGRSVHGTSPHIAALGRGQASSDQ